MREGYFFIALGRQYIDECVLLANTIRKQGDNRPIGLLIHPEDRFYAISKRIFSEPELVDFEPFGDIWRDCTTGFEKFCLWPRIHFDKYIPTTFDSTIVVDSDVLCQYNPDNLWAKLHRYSLPVKMLGREYDPNWHWGRIGDVVEAFGRPVPHVHGGFFYIQHDGFTNDFFRKARDIFWKYDEYKCQRAFRGGRVDEIIFAITHASFNMVPIEFDRVPAMTFNLTPDMEIPSLIQTEGGQNAIMESPCPFSHMFDKMGGDNYEILYRKIMNV